MSNHKEKPSLLTALDTYKAGGYIDKKNIPEPDKLAQYYCKLVCEEYQNQFGDISQVNYFHFTHKIDNSTFKIKIRDAAYASKACYELTWQEEIQENSEPVLGSALGLSLAVCCLDYLHPKPSQENKNASNQCGMNEPFKKEMKQEEKSKLQIIKSDEDDSFVVAGDDEDDQKRSNFGSDEDSIGSSRAIFQRKPSPIYRQRQPIRFAPKSETNYIDCSTQEGKILIKGKLLQYLKLKQNRHRNIQEIKQFLEKNRIDLPDRAIKNILSEICIHPCSDRSKKGYLVKEIFLNPLELRVRKEEEQQEQADREKIKKIVRKSTKLNRHHEQSQSASRGDETLSPFEARDIKESRRRTNNKKKASKDSQ